MTHRLLLLFGQQLSNQQNIGFAKKFNYWRNIYFRNKKIQSNFLQMINDHTKIPVAAHGACPEHCSLKSQITFCGHVRRLGQLVSYPPARLPAQSFP